MVVYETRPIFIMTMANLLSTNVVVSILVSVYRHQQRVDTPTVHYYCIATTYAFAMLLIFNDCTCKSLTAPKIK